MAARGRRREARFYELYCIVCGTTCTEQESSSRCVSCGKPLGVRYDYSYIRARLNRYSLKTSPIKALKYLDFYPILNLDLVVSLDEGGTPLYRCHRLAEELGIKQLYIKNEGMNPTGVFKDRGTLVEITKAKEQGAKAICVASTGNMAGSVAAYASIANLPCYVAVPEGTPIGKMAQSLSYGARVLQIRGTYNDAASIAEQMSRRYGYYLAGDYAFRVEGQKSQAFEIVEQLDWQAPAVVIVPMGCGTNIAALWKGFKEFYELGLISSLPRMIGVQPIGCPPIVAAFNQGTDEIIPVKKPESVASALMAGDPLDGLKALAALRESGGCALSLSDTEILQAQQRIARQESIFVEPSGAIPVGALALLLTSGRVRADETVVCLATGNGLKDPRAALRVLPSPATIDPSMQEVEKFLKLRLYEIRAAGAKNGDKNLFEAVPSVTDVTARVRQEFGVKLTAEYGGKVRSLIEEFVKKGKPIMKADLQYIVENVLKGLSVHEPILTVEDFKVLTSLHGQAEAAVWVLFDGEKVEATAAGVGPVDAVINALKQAALTRGKLFFELIDYNVEISSPGTNASVETTMVMKDAEGNRIVAIGTSPDIIVASVNAFVEGYNLLWARQKG
ncbi:MAG: threonine synthase [Candidatus Methylomirabilis oxygeniifera]|uniref:Threonine synthase n=1 Tax=Methylomirabilis oxygeniifera TaxID=671143 RepID=D5MH80_METO1|nr:MAG: threonine synthase [Candidatus Methylomirabilis oxyfera]CBE69112.1 putative threonine synthase (TS) (modular protein) [Candidatus Methylomirabilis oxyfera]